LPAKIGGQHEQVSCGVRPSANKGERRRPRVARGMDTVEHDWLKIGRTSSWLPPLRPRALTGAVAYRAGLLVVATGGAIRAL
jgi:hypothetical protein